MIITEIQYFFSKIIRFQAIFKDTVEFTCALEFKISSYRQKNSQVSNFNQKPSYVKGRLTAALIVNILRSIENLQCAYS